VVLPGDPLPSRPRPRLRVFEMTLRCRPGTELRHRLRPPAARTGHHPEVTATTHSGPVGTPVHHAVRCCHLTMRLLHARSLAWRIGRGGLDIEVGASEQPTGSRPSTTEPTASASLEGHDLARSGTMRRPSESGHVVRRQCPRYESGGGDLPVVPGADRVSGLGRVHGPTRRRVGRDDPDAAAAFTTALGVVCPGRAKRSALRLAHPVAHLLLVTALRQPGAEARKSYLGPAARTGSHPNSHGSAGDRPHHEGRMRKLVMLSSRGASTGRGGPPTRSSTGGCMSI